MYIISKVIRPSYGVRITFCRPKYRSTNDVIIIIITTIYLVVKKKKNSRCCAAYASDSDENSCTLKIMGTRVKFGHLLSKRFCKHFIFYFFFFIPCTREVLFNHPPPVPPVTVIKRYLFTGNMSHGYDTERGHVLRSTVPWR